MAALFAATDETDPGQAHNPFRSAGEQTYWGVGRFGKEFERRERTASTSCGPSSCATLDCARPSETIPLLSRDAYSSGGDFELNFRERMYRVSGSLVATMIQNAPIAGDPSSQEDLNVGRAATCASASMAATGAAQCGGAGKATTRPQRHRPPLLSGRVLGGRLGPAAHQPGGRLVPHQREINFNYYQSWFYAGRSFEDPANPGTELWSYDPWNQQSTGININSWAQNRSRWSMWWGLWHDFPGTSKYATRFYDDVRGPLMSTGRADGFWWGMDTDWRKDLVGELNFDGTFDEFGSRNWSVDLGLRWVQSARMNHRTSARVPRQLRRGPVDRQLRVRTRGAPGSAA